MCISNRDEWRNEWCLYIALCVLLYTQSSLQSCGWGGGGSLLNHHQWPKAWEYCQAKPKHHQKHLTWAKETNNWTVAQWSKVLFSDESRFSISFGNQGPRVWRKSGGTESKLLEVQCEVSTVCDDLGCRVICWCWSTVFSEVQSQRSHLPGHFRALHASFCWQALWRCWFHFQAGLGTCPHCQRYQKLVQWPWCYCAWLAGKLAWTP